MPLAPIPEFQRALAELKHFDSAPTKENRERLKQVYRNLCKPTSADGPREYGYTAVGEVYNGLVRIIHRALFKRDSVLNAVTQYFCEARWCAIRDARTFAENRGVDFAQAALTAEHAIHDTLNQEMANHIEAARRKYILGIPEDKPEVLETIDCGVF